MLHCTDIAVRQRSEALRQLDVLATAAKRRTFTPEEKARLVAESFASGDSVCAVARRHRLSTSQLYAWRKIARRRRDGSPHQPAPAPERAVLEPASNASSRCATQIEIAIGSAIVRVPHGIDPATLKLVLDTLREG